MDVQMSDLVSAYIQGRADARLEKFDKEAEKLKKEVAGDLLASADLHVELAIKRTEEDAKFKPGIWLSDAATRAKQISFVSHPLKFTHTDAKGSSVYAPRSDRIADESYLTTTTLANPRVDVVGNAAALDVASFLQLEVNGISLASLIAQDDMSALQLFAENDAQLNAWHQGLKQALADKDLRSHTLAKQLYFPIADNAYHLISPLYASSLAHALYQRIADSRFTDTAKEVRKLKKEGKFSEAVTVDFLNVAVQTFGGTKPQNVSQLNSSRGGKSFLLSCQPPSWGERKLPPSSYKNAFWREYDRRAWRTAKELKDYLISIAELDSTKPRRDKRANFVDDLIEILFQYAAEVQNMTECRGWSAESKLSKAEQLWLDPLCPDKEFQAERKAKDWQQDIANQFAGWLNHKLKADQLLMKDTEYREWSKLLEQKLLRLKEDLIFDEDVEELQE